MVTGKEINPVVIDGLLGAAEKGDKKYKTFIEERLIKREKSIFTPIKRANIKTGNECKTKKLKKEIVLIEEKQAFGSLMVAKCKSIKEAFSFPITSVSLSISNPDGTLYSSEKSRFRNNLIGTSIMDKYAYNVIWCFVRNTHVQAYGYLL